MSKRTRSDSEQNTHDRKVVQIARDYRKKEYDVWADDVEGFSDPKSYHGRIPDIVAKKKGHITLVEVETQSSVGTKRDKEQRRRFRQWTSEKTNRHFRRVVV